MYNPDDPWAWVAKAENDLLNIRNNLGCERNPWDTICFHAQQVAEKMLKAFLVSRGQTAGRTHDLVALLAEAVATGGPLNELETECRLLTPYAVLLRYPGTGEEVEELEGREAVAAAECVFHRIRDAIGPEDVP